MCGGRSTFVPFALFFSFPLQIIKSVATEQHCPYLDCGFTLTKTKSWVEAASNTVDGIAMVIIVARKPIEM